MKSLIIAAMATLIFAAPLANSSARTNSPPKHSSKHVRIVEMPANPKLPSLFIIGDSTVRNGQGIGTGGQWGWGDFLAPFFDTNRLNVVNRALGGTSSRTFYRDQWPSVLALLKPGDFVIMQFGHNDSSPINDKSRARGTIPGVGDETQAITNRLTKQYEVVHTFGWYEEKMISEARAKGANPLVCSLIPRNEWTDGHVRRNNNDYAGWAAQVAKSENVPFLDINDIIADEYDAMGQKKVKPLFIAGAGPHTSKAGAETNATCVVAAIKGLQPENPLMGYFSAKANEVTPATPTIVKNGHQSFKYN